MDRVELDGNADRVPPAAGKSTWPANRPLPIEFKFQETRNESRRTNNQSTIKIREIMERERGDDHGYLYRIVVVVYLYFFTSQGPGRI